jgi:choline dehydrogenase-like flavoprotein
MQQTFRALVDEMGGQVYDKMPEQLRGYGIARGGEIIHELGTVRMGADPTKSVLDPNCRAHDVKNLFVTDGGPFVSQADKNPTWTILALSMRTSEYIAQERKRGAL